MSKPLFTNVPDLDREKWLTARCVLAVAGECQYAPNDCKALDDNCDCDRQTTALFGECPPPPAPEYRVDRSDGHGAHVKCLAGDRVSIEYSNCEMRSADAIELGEALIAAGRYLEAHR